MSGLMELEDYLMERDAVQSTRPGDGIAVVLKGHRRAGDALVEASAELLRDKYVRLIFRVGRPDFMRVEASMSQPFGWNRADDYVRTARHVVAWISDDDCGQVSMVLHPSHNLARMFAKAASWLYAGESIRLMAADDVLIVDKPSS